MIYRRLIPKNLPKNWVEVCFYKVHIFYTFQLSNKYNRQLFPLISSNTFILKVVKQRFVNLNSNFSEAGIFSQNQTDSFD